MTITERRSDMADKNDEYADYVIIDPPTKGNGDDPRRAIWFNVSDVVVDHNVQRLTMQGRVEDLSSKFDFNKAEAITITIRDDDVLVVTEGQTRVLSRKDTHPGSHMWGVISTDSNESGVALGIARGRKPLTPYDKWRLRLHMQDPRCLAAKQVMDFMEPPLALYDRTGKSGYGLSAVGVVDTIMGTYGDDVQSSALLLRSVLQVLAKAWPLPTEPRRFDGRLMDALRLIMTRNAEIIDTDRLVEKLQTTTARRWYQYGSDRAGTDTAASAIAREIIKVYNYQKQSRRIVL